MAAAAKLAPAEMAGEVKVLTQTVMGASEGEGGRAWGGEWRESESRHRRSVGPKPTSDPRPFPSPPAAETLPAVRKAALLESLQALTKQVMEEQKKAAAANKEKAVAAAVAAADAGASGSLMPRCPCCWWLLAGLVCPLLCLAWGKAAQHTEPSPHPPPPALFPLPSVPSAAAAASGAKFLVSRIEVGLDTKALQVRGGAAGGGWRGHRCLDGSGAGGRGEREVRGCMRAVPPPQRCL